MKTIKKNGVSMFEAEEGCLLEVWYEGEQEPVFYERLATWLIGPKEQIREVKLTHA
jgi:hypothetical protein